MKQGIVFSSPPLGFTAGTIWPNKEFGKECLKKQWGTKSSMKAVILIQQENKLAMKEVIHSLLQRNCGLVELWEEVVQKWQASLWVCEVNHGCCPSKSKQEIYGESVKSAHKPFFVSCVYVTLYTVRNDLLLNTGELMCAITGSQRIYDNDLGVL